LYATNSEVKRNLKFAGGRVGVAENENGEAVHGEAPDDAEGIEVGEEGDIAVTDDDGGDLESDDDVDDAIARAEARMSTPFEPTIAVLTAPAMISVPTATTKMWKARRARKGPSRFMARPPMRFSRKFWRTLSGMIITAKKETSEVKTRL